MPIATVAIVGPDRGIFNVVDDELVALSSSRPKSPDGKRSDASRMVADGDSGDNIDGDHRPASAIYDVSEEDGVAPAKAASPVAVARCSFASFDSDSEDREAVPVISAAIWHSLLEIDEENDASTSSSSVESTTVVERTPPIGGESADSAKNVADDGLGCPEKASSSETAAAAAENLADISATLGNADTAESLAAECPAHLIEAGLVANDTNNEATDNPPANDDDADSDWGTEIVSPEYELHRPGSRLGAIAPDSVSLDEWDGLDVTEEIEMNMASTDAIGDSAANEAMNCTTSQADPLAEQPTENGLASAARRNNNDDISTSTDSNGSGFGQSTTSEYNTITHHSYAP